MPGRGEIARLKEKSFPSAPSFPRSSTIMVEVLEEEVVVHTPTPSGSEDASGSRGPRHRRRNSLTPPRRDPSWREDPTRSGGSALSPPPGGGKPRRVRARRRLTYGDAGLSRGAIQEAGALLRRPPVNSEPETPVQRWLDDMTNLVTTAQQQLAAGGRPAATSTSRTPTTLSSSARRRARHHRGPREAGGITTASTGSRTLGSTSSDAETSAVLPA